MKQFFKKAYCALFGHDYELYRYTKQVPPYNSWKMFYGMRCRHCGKLWWDK